MSYTKEHAARAIAHELLKSGFIAFEEKDVAHGLQLRATIGVASKDATELLDKEMTSRANEMLTGITDAAREKISQWGSDYTGNNGPIEKGMAIRFMKESFDNHMKKVRERLGS